MFEPLPAMTQVVRAYIVMKGTPEYLLVQCVDRLLEVSDYVYLASSDHTCAHVVTEYRHLHHWFLEGPRDAPFPPGTLLYYRVD